MTAQRRRFTIEPTIDVSATIAGAKGPVLVGPGEARWSTNTPEGPGTLSLEPKGSEVAASAWGPGAEWLLEQAPKLYGAADDLTGWAPQGNIAEYWRRHPFRLARTDRPWDALVGAVLGQKVQTTAARASRRAIARTFGQPAPGPFGGWILPTAEAMAQLSYFDLHPMGVERKRADTLIRVAREMKRIRSLTDRTPREVQQRLEHIRGIGPWTSGLVTAVSMGDADAVPTGDFHLPNGAAWWLAGEPRGTDERMLELLAPYEGHRWRTLRIVKALGPAPRYGPRLALHGDGLAKGR